MFDTQITQFKHKLWIHETMKEKRDEKGQRPVGLSQFVSLCPQLEGNQDDTRVMDTATSFSPPDPGNSWVQSAITTQQLRGIIILTTEDKCVLKVSLYENENKIVQCF